MGTQVKKKDNISFVKQLLTKTKVKYKQKKHASKHCS